MQQHSSFIHINLLRKPMVEGLGLVTSGIQVDPHSKSHPIAYEGPLSLYDRIWSPLPKFCGTMVSGRNKECKYLFTYLFRGAKTVCT